jgi:hypothetical protein
MSDWLDFFFFFGSTYTYLTIMRIEAEAQAVGVEVRWRPFSVRQIMAEMHNIPFADKPAKLNYMWRDIERRASRYGIPFAGRPEYPADRLLLANLVGSVAAEEGWCPEYAKASIGLGSSMTENSASRSMSAMSYRSLGGTLRVSSTALKATKTKHASKVRRRQPEASASSAPRRSSPTVRFSGGDDRLEDALDWARSPH